jgi:antitoxin FitA
MRRALQIRGVPEHVLRTLKSRAAKAGMSLSKFLRAELTALANRPTLDELIERIARRERPRRPIDSTREVRAERDGRR